jgi:hypothetical protein
MDTCVGAMADTSFKVQAQLTDNLRTKLVISTGTTKANFDAGIVTKSVEIAPTALSYRKPDEGNTTIYIVEHTVTGLTANTNYTYAIEHNNIIDYDSIHPVKTYYTEDADPPSTVTDAIIFGSCMENDGQGTARDNEYPPMLKASEESNIRVWINSGDFSYHNAISTAVAQSDSPGILVYMHAMRASRDFQALLSKYNFVHTPSDHDAISSDGNNETTGAALMVPACYDIIRAITPRYPFPSGSNSWVQGVPQTFKDGKVTYIILDTQYPRS